jgi:hypothetical protein
MTGGVGLGDDDEDDAMSKRVVVESHGVEVTSCPFVRDVPK